jgi:squalene-hopene/tetraprenyl-beta-curcumene cyclase
LPFPDVAAPPALSREEPLAREFSAERAARALDTAALHWAKTRGCAACHTIPPYLMARQSLAAVAPVPPGVRRFVEDVVARRREGEPKLSPDAVSAVLVGVAVGLAADDRATTGKLHPLTRQALDRMWSVQRADGGWQWPFRDVPPVKLDEHYGATFAALGAGLAPEGYARTEPARKGLDGVRRFLAANPPQSLHQQTMLLWASLHVGGLLSEAGRAEALRQLLAAQRPDGGWALASLVDNVRGAAAANGRLKELQAENGYGSDFLVYLGRVGVYRSPLESDGYATGLAVYVARQAGVPAEDARLRRGVGWLKANQRASGRWFTRSQGNHGQHYLSNTGTAYAVLALAACAEIRTGPGKGSPSR